MKADKQSFKTGSAVNLSTSALNITGLLGNTYDYTIIARFTNASADSILDITLNSDTTANYRNYEMKGLSSTASAAVGDSDTAIELQNIIGTANPGLLIMSIIGSSGDERYIDCFYSGDGAILKQSSYWKNTADEVDEITFTAASSVTCDYEITIYRTPKEASQEKWELVDTYNASGVNYNTSPTTIFSSLSGDTDLQYKLVINTDTGFDSRLRLRMNGDSGTNYTAQRLSNNGGTISAANSTGRNGFQWSDLNIDHDSVATIIINAESGVKRLISSSESNNQTKGNEQDEQACWWNNTVDELTSIVLYDATNIANDTIDIKLYRRKNPNTISDTLPFEMVEEESFSSTDWSAGSTYTVSGDDVLLYKIEGLLSNASGDIEIRMELNSDTAANYPEQLLKGDTSTASAASATRNYIVLAKLQNGDQAEFSHYLYPKSGENRPMLTECSYDENALEKLAQWWNNSADSINSIKIYASSSNAITGTLKLSRLMAGGRIYQPDMAALTAANSEYFSVASNASLNPSSFTFLMWVKTSANINLMSFIDKWNGSSGYYFCMLTGGTIRANVYTSSDQQTASSTTINDGNWHQIGFSWDNSTSELRILIDGAEEIASSKSGTITTGSDDFQIGGALPSLNYMTGELGPCMMWNSVISTSDVNKLYRNGKATCYDDLNLVVPNIKANMVSFWNLCTWANGGVNEEDDLHGSNNLTNNNTVPFTGSGLDLHC